MRFKRNIFSKPDDIDLCTYAICFIIAFIIAFFIITYYYLLQLIYAIYRFLYMIYAPKGCIRNKVRWPYLFHINHCILLHIVLCFDAYFKILHAIYYYKYCNSIQILPFHKSNIIHPYINASFGKIPKLLQR